MIKKEGNVEIVNLNLGGKDKVTLDSLIRTLEATRRGLKELSNNLYDPKTTEVEIFVEPFKEGSFDINLIVQVATIVGGFASVFVPLGKAFFKTLVVRKRAKGKIDKVTEDVSNNTFIIHTGEGDINIEKDIFHAMTKTKAYEEETTKAFKALDDDDSRTDFTITVSGDKSETLTETITKEEMAHLRKPLNLTKNLIKLEQTINRVWIKVEVVKFTEGQTKWTFSFNGERFNAEIEDNDFIEKINNQEYSFYKGSMIDCDLEIITTNEPGKKAQHIRAIKKVYDVSNPINVEVSELDI